MDVNPHNKFLTANAIAHRGLHDRALARPENSQAAFAAAVRRGYAIELDVRLSSDGEPVVFHDADLSRMTGTAGTVAQTPAAELTRLSLLGSTEKIPLFGDVLGAVDGAVPIAIEVKSEGEPDALTRSVCDTLSRYDGRFALMSFDPVVLDTVEECAPNVPRGLLFSLRPGIDWPAEIMDRVGSLHFVGCDVRGLPYDPVPALQGKIPVLGWTVTSPEVEKLARRWCDNFIFEGYDPAP